MNIAQFCNVDEYSGDSTQLLYLRSRFYAPSSGRFVTKDIWEGEVYRPLSLNRWNYVESNPINLVDPTGNFPAWCRAFPFKWTYAECVLNHYHLKPAGSIFFNGDAVANVKGMPFCWSGRVEYRAGGYIEGYSWFGSIAGGVWGGKEVVYSFAQMERDEFTYIGGGLNDTLPGVGVAIYAGIADGLRSDRQVTDHYMGKSFVRSAGGDIAMEDILSLGVGGTMSTSISDWKLRTLSVYVGISGGVGLPIFDGGIGIVNYEAGNGTYHSYKSKPGTMLTDMIQGRYTPYPPTLRAFNNISALYTIRAKIAQDSAYYFYVYQEMQDEELRSNNTDN